MSIMTKSDKGNKKLFLCHGDVFFNDIDIKEHGLLFSIVSKSTGNVGEFQKQFKKEMVTHGKYSLDENGDTVVSRETYEFYISDYDIQHFNQSGILQVFELCRSIENGNYFGVDERSYVLAY